MADKNLTFLINLAGNLEREAAKMTRELQELGNAGKQAMTGADQSAKKFDKTLTGMAQHAQRSERALMGIGRVNMSGAGSWLDKIVTKLKKVESSAKTAMSTLGKVGNIGAGIAVGATVGGAVIKSKYQDLASYDTGLRNAANISFSDRDVPGREKGIEEIAALVKQKTIEHGGTASQALEAYEKLAGKGFSHDEIKVKMDDVLHYRTATGAQPEELINTQQAIQNFGVDGQKGLEWGMVAGKKGSNELGDQAKFLPSQLANAGKAGMSGEKDLKEILALNQAAMTTAGNADQANNNVVNLLAKINSSETSKDMGKQGIDYDAAIQKGIGENKSALQVYAESINQIAMKDATYRNVSARVDTETDPEKKKVLLKQQEAALGSATGLIASDLQEAMAAIAYLKQRKYMDSIKTEMDNAQGTVESSKDKQTNRQGLEEKGNQVGNAKFFGEWQGMSGMMGSLGSGLESIANWFNENPTTAGVTAAGATGATALFSAGLSGGLLSQLGNLFKSAPAVTAEASAAQTAAKVVRPYGWTGAASAEAAAANAAGTATAGSMATAAGLVAIPSALLAWLGTSIGKDNQNNTAAQDFSKKIGWNTQGSLLDSVTPKANGGVPQTSHAAIPFSPNAAASTNTALFGGNATGFAYGGSSMLNNTTGIQSAVANGVAQGFANSNLAQLGGAYRNNMDWSAGFAGTKRTEISNQTAQPPQKVEVDVKDGSLMVAVRVSDDRVTSTASILQQFESLKLTVGNMNPGGYTGKK